MSYSTPPLSPHVNGHDGITTASAVVSPDGLSEAHRKLYDDMVHYMKLKLQRPFTTTKIIMLLASGVKFLGQIRTLTGPEKKNLVLHAIREVVQNSTYIDENEKVEIIMLIDTFADGIIEMLVDFAKDAYTFIKNKVKDCKWCPCLKSGDPVTSARALSSTSSLEEYQELKTYLKLKLQKPVTGPKILLMVAAGVRYIEHYKNLSGMEKKDIVINVMRDVILEADFISDTDKGELVGVVDLFADEAIDYLVDFGKHMYLKIKGKCMKCC